MPERTGKRMQERIIRLQDCYHSGATLEADFRRGQLEALRRAVKKREAQLTEALQADLGKAPFEAYATEIGMVYEEIALALKHLNRWMRDRRMPTPISQFPARSCIHYEPYGTALIIAPWNYPVQLSLSPLVGALAAGNAALVKPSEHAPAVAQVLEAVIGDMASPAAACMQGGREETQALLKQPFDLIFFTGSVEVGKAVMAAAAQNLTPVVLELGGKSPCILAPDADLPLAARRIAWGKWLNAGQTCVAPDYVLCPKDKVEETAERLRQAAVRQFGPQPLESGDYPRIINEKHFDRLTRLIKASDVIWGGESDRERLRIGPTVIAAGWDSPVMEEEIFGPLLPVVAYDRLEEALDQVRLRPRPLALYFFTGSRPLARRVMRSVSFGGGCVNDTVVHLVNPHLPFGGVGSSGMGCYHGRHSFEAFSHKKAIMTRGAWLDLPVRYPPYHEKAERVVRRLMK